MCDIVSCHKKERKSPFTLLMRDSRLMPSKNPTLKWLKPKRMENIKIIHFIEMKDIHILCTVISRFCK